MKRGQHPSLWITSFIERHALTLDHVAAAMAKGDGREKAFGIHRLSLDMYVLVGPGEPSMRLGEMARDLDRALQRRAGFFADLERAWIAGGFSKEGLPS
jgi:hypothetical protein